MKANDIKGHVRAFRRDYALSAITLPALLHVLDRQGFTVVEFNPVINEPDVQTVIDSLHLAEMITRSSGFLYVDPNLRLVFVNEKLSQEEKLLVLSHEEAHYYLGHTASAPQLGRNVLEEYEANEFVHYLLEISPGKSALLFLARWKGLLLLGLLVLGLLLGGRLGFKKHQERLLYEGEFYVTEHGRCYHRKCCMTISGHAVRRLTREDVLAGSYEPCSVCQPDL